MAILDFILSFIGGVVAITSALAPVILSLKKDIKNKKSKEDFFTLLSILPKYIVEAEKLSEATSAQKLDFVLKSLYCYARSSGLTFDRLALQDEIENLISLTKQVNVIIKPESK